MAWPRLRSWIKGVFLRRQLEHEMDDELRFHLEARTDDLMARRQLSREEAYRQSRIEFGGVQKYREAVREARGLRIADEVAGDVRYAVRQLRRSPAFSVVAILTLALGIGANTSIFSLVNALILRSLPVAHPEQLVEMVYKYPRDPRLNLYRWKDYERCR